MLSISERFFEKVMKDSDPDKYWGWKGSRDRQGYPTLNIDKKPVTGNRISWIMFHGHIPKGMCVLHSCDNPACTNIKHLWLGTKRDNAIDMVRKGRGNYRRWPDHHNSKVKDKVEQIKALVKSGWSYRRVGRHFGVCHHTIIRAYQQP